MNEKMKTVIIKNIANEDDWKRFRMILMDKDYTVTGFFKQVVRSVVDDNEIKTI